MANRDIDSSREVRQELTERFADTRRFGDSREPDQKPSKPNLLQKNILERITKRDLAVFARQLALLLDLGVTLLRALNIITLRTKNQRLVTIVEKIGSNVETGKSLSDSLREHTSVFGEFFITSIQAGEEAGTIGDTLKHLADYLERDEILRGKIRKSLSFPLLTLLIAGLVVGFLMIFVIPTFAEVYSEVGVQLPTITQIVITVSEFVATFWWLILLIIVGLILVFHRSGRTLGLGKFVDRVKLGIPVIRDMTIKMSVYRFSRITATMLDSGVPLMTTLRLAAEATDNSIISDSILKACDDIDKGSTIEKALKNHRAFPPFVLDMIGIGEEAGSVSEVLRRISTFYERDVDDLVSNLATVIEPIMTLFMGIIVALIALSLFMPYFNMNQVIGA